MPQTPQLPQEILIGKNFSVFIQELKDRQATEYFWYLKGGKDMLQSIEDDIRKEYEMCPRLSDFAYQTFLMSIRLRLEQLEPIIQGEPHND